MITIYTDGACSGNPGVGGWGVVIIKDDKNETFLNGGDNETTNNKMELTAAIEALKHFQSKKDITLITDSKYVKNVPLIDDIEEIISINHSYDYIKNIKSKIPNEGFKQLDPDTYLSKKSLEAAYMGVSSSIEALKNVMLGNSKSLLTCAPL